MKKFKLTLLLLMAAAISASAYDNVKVDENQSTVIILQKAKEKYSKAGSTPCIVCSHRQ